MTQDTTVGLPDLLSAVIAERDKYADLLEKGKGEWPNKGYVRDETWAGWQHTHSVLESLVRRFST